MRNERVSAERTRERSTRDDLLVLPDGRWSVPGTWLWREPTGRFARVDLAEVIYRVRFARAG